MFIERPPRLFRWMYPRAMYRLERYDDQGRPKIYLTFDDGPIPEVTPFVLDTLQHYGIHATFFMVGDNARRYPELLEQVRSRGHAIGNHTMHHLRGSHATTRRYLRDLLEADKLLHTPLFRPPHGWLRLRQARALGNGFRLVLYDLVTRDYSSRLTAEQVLGIIKKYARPGAIVVMHDSLKSRDKLPNLLPAAIEYLLQQGYTFYTLQ